MGDYRKAIDYTLRALKIAKKLENEARQVLCFINLGEIHNLLGDYKRSTYYLEKLLAFNSALVDPVSKARLFISLAFMYHSQNKILESKKYQTRSINLVKNIQKSRILGQLYLKIGNLKFFSESYKTAIKYFNSALSLAIEFMDKDSEAIANVCLGSSYAKIDNMRLSEKFHDEGLRLAKRLNNATLQSVININLGKINYLANPNKSFTYLEKFIHLNEKFGKQLLEEEQKILFFG